MKTKAKFPLEKLVPLYRQMLPHRWEGGRLCGTLSVRDADTAILLQDLLQEDYEDDYPCNVVVGDPENVRIGDKLELHFGAIQTAVGSVFRDVDSLLRNFSLAAGAAELPWYVSSENVASWDTESDLVKRLGAVKRLVKVLSESAEIFDSQRCVLIFIRGSRFDVPVRYGASDLMALDVAAAEKFIAALGINDGHAPQRNEICATAVCELLASNPPGDRFKTLLRKIGELHQRVTDGYRLFASSFSYEKVRDQVEALRIEYAGKIHKTISDIQAHLLGIPVSTVIVATQLKSATGNPDQVWINAAVLAGAIFFCLLLFFALWNQHQTLTVIRQEIDRQENVLRKDNAAIADRLVDQFVYLRNRITWHHIILAAVASIAVCGLMGAIGVFAVLDATAK